MDLNELFSSWERKLASQSEEAGIVQHAGDRGENREAILKSFLEDHLPTRYGVVKGEVITKAGKHSPSMDLLIYDKVNCPLLHVGDTKVLPIEGVYGAIEVKSRLTKDEFLDAANRIKTFKELSPRDLSVIQTREYVTVHRPTRPFGIVFGFELGDNSLQSLHQNWDELCEQIHWVDYFVNLVVVLGNGVLHYQRVDFDAGEKHALLDTDEFVTLIEIQEKRRRNGEAPLNLNYGSLRNPCGALTFGRFFVYLLVMLERLKLAPPDLGQYFDPTMPPVIHRES